MTYREIMGNGISVRLRSCDDSRLEIGGGFLGSLREIGGNLAIVRVEEGLMDNPLAVLILLGDSDQFDAVCEVAGAWVTSDLTEHEDHERIVGIFAPEGGFLTWVWIEDEALGRVPLEAWRAEVLS